MTAPNYGPRFSMFWETAEHIIAAFFSKHGKEITTRQLQRWQQAGIISAPIQSGRGRGGGSSVYYPPGTFAQVEVAADLIDGGFSLDNTRAALWGVNYAAPARVEMARRIAAGTPDEE